jgi:hypothetical protein
MARQNIERQNKLEPKRMQYAIDQIVNLGYEIIYKDETKLKFEFMGGVVTLFPYSGWHTGKTIKDGRGLEKLIKQINPESK